jgi:putative transposase
MPRKRYKPEEIVAELRQVDVLVSQGQNMVDAIRQIGVSEVTFYRWRQEFGGLKSDQVKQLKDLELENSRLRKTVSDLTPDTLILTEAATDLDQRDTKTDGGMGRTPTYRGLPVGRGARLSDPR